MLILGSEAISDFRGLRHLAPVIGPVASTRQCGGRCPRPGSCIWPRSTRRSPGSADAVRTCWLERRPRGRHVRRRPNRHARPGHLAGEDPRLADYRPGPAAAHPLSQTPTERKKKLGCRYQLN
jgi:hypothetical protein